MKNVNNGWLQVQITARSAGTPIPPYAVPEAVRVRRLSHDVVLIEFRYRDGEEPIREQELDDRVSMYIGRYSQRLMAVKLYITRIIEAGLQMVPKRDAVAKAMDGFWAQATNRLRGDYDPAWAERAFAEQRESILNELVPA